MKLLIKDIKRIPILILGFVSLSFGIIFMIRANLGLDSWGIFHQGLAEKLGTTFGMLVFISGLIILALSVWLLKTKVGIGTILNVMMVGFMIDAADVIITYTPDTILERIVLLVVALITMTFGRSLYISARLGAGARDGLFVGISRVFKIDVKYVKPGIEFTVLFFGFLLGGTFGYGTIFLIITSGYCVQYFLKLLRFDPKTEKQRKFSDYRL